MEIILHLGVHKTGTTYLQDTLYRNLQLLNNNGIVYVPLKHMRFSYTQKIRKKEFNSKIFKTIVDSQNRKANKLIISDENILGGPFEIVRTANLYNNFFDHITYFRNTFSNYNFKIVITFRNYIDYFISLYCEYIRNKNTFITFREFYKDFDYLNFNWATILRELKKINNVHIKVISYEEFKQNNHIIFNELLGDIKLNLYKAKTSTMRSKFSAETISILESTNMNISSVFKPELIEKSLIKSAKSLYMPFTKSEHKHLSNNYKSHSKLIY